MNLKNGMKVFADCETAEYLTRSKEYEVIKTNPTHFHIKDDDGIERICRLKNCWHLNGNNWQIVKTNNESAQIQIRLKSERKKAIQHHRKNNTNYTSDSAYILALIDADIDKFKNK